MKVFDLQCAQQHSFEGWFASEAEFHRQLEGGLVSCPLCGDEQIAKKLSAPRLNLRAAKAETASEAEHVVAVSNHPAQVELAQLHARMLKALREIVANTEDVGERFVEQARAMHHGEIERRNIRGSATTEAAMELLEEGVEVMPLPLLPVVKETLQ